ncbi:ribonuclease III [Lindgomyces ingoldianus]|uniref:Ribonuclease III n=1 Tax=Lindgomyces ingoldianus TaxID=673940 RepID=A0ACB6R547_9PLEO|nr:ribonuclease III [Lindgomyces ingoldianus]KAF2474301.1 ribonuclease III [Lindgomyces ingoldianus]
MAEKRQRPYDGRSDSSYRHRDHGHGQPYHKKHKPNTFNQHSTLAPRPRDRDPTTGFSNVPRNSHQGPKHTTKKSEIANPILEHFERLPDPSKCEPCKLAASETQNGLLALLHQLEQEEEGNGGDQDILYHARELRNRLSTRAKDSPASKTMQKLEQRYPCKAKYVTIPTYVARKIELAKDLPPLPPVIEPYLKEAVFTHKSLNSDPSVTEKLNYERLEFLGDAYIEIISSRLIYNRFAHLESGKQAQLRESLVKNETLALLSNAYGLGDRIAHVGHLQHDKGWTKILADVFEAYVAAIILSDPDNGFKTAENWLAELWAVQLLEYKEKPLEDPNAREEIRKLLGGKGIALDYRMERDMEQTHGVQRFFMGLYLTGWGYEDQWLGSGEGQNKAQASIHAAMDALKNNRTLIEDGLRQKLEMYPQLKEKLEGSKQKGQEGRGVGAIQEEQRTTNTGKVDEEWESGRRDQIKDTDDVSQGRKEKKKKGKRM